MYTESCTVKMRSDILCNGGCRAVVYSSTVVKLHANLCYLVDQLSFSFLIYICLKARGQRRWFAKVC
jgi:hypothetical protein